MPEPRSENTTARQLDAANFWYSLAAVLVVIFLASKAGSEVKWVSNKPVYAQLGFWPVMAVSGMLVFGVAALVQQVRRSGIPSLREASVEFLIWLKALEYVLWFLAYVLLVGRLGYLPSTLLFTLALTVRLGYRSRKMLTASIGLAVGTVLFFKSLLSVKIPGGQVYELLPDGLRNFMMLYF